MGHPVEYDSGSSLAIFFLEFLFFLFLAFHHFFTIFLEVFFFLSFNRNTYAMTSNFFSFSNCVYHCFQVVCFNILGRGSRMYICCHAHYTIFQNSIN